MGILRDIFEIVTKDLEIDPLDSRNYKKSYSSISKQASEGTMQFGLLVSKAMGMDIVQKVANAYERNCASFAQIVLTMNPTMDLSKDKDGADYLRNFHQNSDTTTDMVDDALLNTSFSMENCTVLQRTFTCESACFYKLKDELKEHGIDFNEGKLNDVVKPKPLKENRIILPKTKEQMKAVLEAGNTADNKTSNVNIKITNSDGGKLNTNKTEEIVMRNILRDNDVKKSNELVPTLLHIRVVATDSKGKNNVNKYVDFIVGVKATIHPIKSEEMIENLVEACKNHDGFFKFIKWTTGEISFLQDFLLNISEAKKDVFNRTSGSSPWWIALKRRRVLAKMKKSMFISKRILPNAAIVITQEEAEYIKNNHGFDLMDPVFVAKIMDKFFLLAFIVVDNSTEVVYLKYDGQNSYQTVSFAGLEKENSNSARNFKDILKAVQRI